jgi:hypothetical protein
MICYFCAQEHTSIKAAHPDAQFFIPAPSPEEALPDTDLVEVSEDDWVVWHRKTSWCGKPPHWAQWRESGIPLAPWPDMPWQTWFDTRRGGACMLVNADPKDFWMNTNFVGVRVEGQALIYRTEVGSISFLGNHPSPPSRIFLKDGESGPPDRLRFERWHHYAEEAQHYHLVIIPQLRADIAAAEQGR